MAYRDTSHALELNKVLQTHNGYPYPEAAWMMPWYSLQEQNISVVID
ncbi:hypothetical protein BMETH_262522336229, partial [methanotrophic bacterial endosymbiont of Bathymodiolus sp.]